jgi:hypothetical protein
MSRSGYTDDLETWDLIKWRGQVASAIRGRRGQIFLIDLLAALDAMPEKVLIVDDLQDAEGDVCAIGALGRARGIDMSKIDPEDPPQVAAAFDIAEQLAQEVVYENDEWSRSETPQQRWTRMRRWVESRILKSDAVIAHVEPAQPDVKTD